MASVNDLGSAINIVGGILDTAILAYAVYRAFSISGALEVPYI
jgi:hypothetical protein